MKTNDIQNNVERAPVETGVIIKVGLDVHAVKIAVCAQIDGATAQPAQHAARAVGIGRLAERLAIQAHDRVGGEHDGLGDFRGHRACLRERQTGHRLRELADSSPTNVSDLPAWYKRASEFEAVLRADGGALSDSIPHFVWHYLADADIRARDLAYRADQQAAILEIIIALEAGRRPECAG